MAVYLDHAATMPMPPEVLTAYTEALALVGNPSSIHGAGRNAKRLLEESRERLAELLGADPIEVTFTSGGTESINLAIKGLWWASSGGPVWTTRAEHHATLDAIHWLTEREGASVEWLEVDELGALIVRPIDPGSALVSALWANTEVGTLQPLAELMAAAGPVPVHADAVGALGSVPIHFHDSQLTALSLSAHKIGGPVGIGALLLRRGANPVPLLHGGGQQQFRSGTQNAAGAHAFAVAAERAISGLEQRSRHKRELAQRLLAGITSAVPGAVLRGDPVNRLPGNVHVTIPGFDGDELLLLLDREGFSVSTGSACQAGVAEISHVLHAMGVAQDQARGALRMTLGDDNTAEQVDDFVAALGRVTAR